MRVLLVEDNPADAELTREILEANKLHLDLHVVVDGRDAIDFLHKRGRFAAAPRPDLIVLDLNVPRVHGKDVLAAIKQASDLRIIPVVVLTSSAAETDILESYDLGANCYVTKPLDLRSFERIVKSLECFWFTIVALPPEGTGAEGN